MKYILILSILLTTYCKAQKKEDQKIETIKLHAFVSSVNEKNIMNSITKSSHFERFQTVIYNKKEYSMKDARKILDSIGTYTFNIKLDSITNRKLLFIIKTEN